MTCTLPAALMRYLPLTTRDVLPYKLDNIIVFHSHSLKLQCIAFLPQMSSSRERDIALSQWYMVREEGQNGDSVRRGERRGNLREEKRDAREQDPEQPHQ